MRIKELIKSLEVCPDMVSSQDFEVRGIACNSKEVSDNFVFVAITGTHIDGHRFIQEAIERGAKAIIAQYQVSGIRYQEGVNFIKVEDTRKALAKLAAEFYGYPARKIKVVGITGTNGKTTVSYLLEALLKKAGFNPAVIGTINYRFHNKSIPSKNTTPGPLELQSFLAALAKKNAHYAVMEVSSHALNQDRVLGIDFSSAIFTNLTQDHLDYHLTLENYFQAKLKLFKGIKPGVFIVVNTDDEYGRRIQALAQAEGISYALETEAEVMAKEIKFGMSYTEFLLVASGVSIRFKTRLIGRHNVYNILAAVAWAQKENLDLAMVKSALEEFYFVPGRLERIDFKGDFSVFVDYAHTEDALNNVLKTLRQLNGNKVIVVFGCGGERDKAKRPKMGRVVSELADYAVITNDNPRSEDPEAILEDIKKGIRKDNFCVIPDRQEAIKKSLSLACGGDIILIAGKGHENYQILKDKIIDFDDRRVVEECLKSMNY